jgi:hypothetical protein
MASDRGFVGVLVAIVVTAAVLFCYVVFLTALASGA